MEATDYSGLIWQQNARAVSHSYVSVNSIDRETFVVTPIFDVDKPVLL